MSVFFSFGAVLSSVLAYFILPPNSCSKEECNVYEENNGWRYMLAILGSLVSFVLFYLCNYVFRILKKMKFIQYFLFNLRHF